VRGGTPSPFALADIAAVSDATFAVARSIRSGAVEAIGGTS
jgi:hypothetical protein